MKLDKTIRHKSPLDELDPILLERAKKKGFNGYTIISAVDWLIKEHGLIPHIHAVILDDFEHERNSNWGYEAEYTEVRTSTGWSCFGVTRLGYWDAMHDFVEAVLTFYL